MLEQEQHGRGAGAVEEHGLNDFDQVGIVTQNSTFFTSLS
jgi:hypothetical protein